MPLIPTTHRFREALLVALLLYAVPAVAQEVQAEPQTRAEILERERAEKRGRLEPYVISDAEARVRFFETWRLPRRLFTKGSAGSVR